MEKGCIAPIFLSAALASAVAFGCESSQQAEVLAKLDRKLTVETSRADSLSLALTRKVERLGVLDSMLAQASQQNDVLTDSLVEMGEQMERLEEESRMKAGDLSLLLRDRQKAVIVLTGLMEQVDSLKGELGSRTVKEAANGKE
jgi:septal ring factor EnvC (AmiA/AmiB activator)